ncbi:MAG: FixH family protein [Nitrospiraceae bacterium]|nr:FixH family protein [Nitrospiraceae bacterium]
MKRSKAFLTFVAASVFFLLAGTAFAGGLALVGHSADLTLRVALDKKPAPGRNNVSVAITDRSGRPVTDALVRVYWVMPAMGAMPSMRGFADASRAGREYHAVMNLETPGTWLVMVKMKRGGRLMPPVRFNVDAE